MYSLIFLVHSRYNYIVHNMQKKNVKKAMKILKNNEIKKFISSMKVKVSSGCNIVSQRYTGPCKYFTPYVKPVDTYFK